MKKTPQAPYFAWNDWHEGAINEQGRKVVEHPTASDHSDAEKEHRTMAVDSQYTDSACADNPKVFETWKPIGVLARALAEKAGGDK